MATTRKIFTDVMGGREVSQYIGIKGEIFYDQDTGALRISDGETPGGNPVTTAGSVSRFVAVNVDGGVAGSANGIDWNDYDTNMSGINRVAVGPNNIVYIADSSADSDSKSLWYANVYDTPPTEVEEITDRQFAQVKYFSSISKFVAVGNNGAFPPQAALYHSADGISWTMNEVTSGFLESLQNYDGSSTFVDIEENGSGFFVISSDTTVGGFYIQNITDTLDGDTHVSLSDITGEPGKVLWTNAGEFIGWHILIADGPNQDDWYLNQNVNPSVGNFSGDFIPIADVLSENIGISSSPSEFVVGEYDGISTVMISTNDGQIIYWPAIPAGPYVSIPKPYTATITAWTDSATSAITITGDDGNTGEKFTVTGSSVADYNGTFYLGAAGAVFTDIERNTPFDTTGLDPFTGTATITWSHGQYIDALHYSNGIFYAGNDNEEVFRSLDGGATWTQVDQLSGGQGEGDGYLNDIDSFIGTTNNTGTGDISFTGVEIRGVASSGHTGLIKLVPATGVDGHSFLDHGQYIKVYPTNQFDAPHIHIAAGEGSNSEGDLFLGDDTKHVEVNHNGYVNIQSYNTDTYNTYRWEFDDNGRIRLPGGLTSYAQSNTYDDTAISLNVNALINKIVPTADAGGNKYTLADGVEGQLMHIVAGTGGEVSNEYTTMSIAHARYTNGAGVITEGAVSGWLPFHHSSVPSTVLTLIFTDGHWNLPHNSFD